MERLRGRASALVRRGFGLADAAHISYAEEHADYFLSVDDRLLRKAGLADLAVTVCSPVHFCMQKDLK